MEYIYTIYEPSNTSFMTDNQSCNWLQPVQLPVASCLKFGQKDWTGLDFKTLSRHGNVLSTMFGTSNRLTKHADCSSESRMTGNITRVKLESHKYGMVGHCVLRLKVGESSRQMAIGAI